MCFVLQSAMGRKRLDTAGYKGWDWDNEECRGMLKGQIFNINFANICIMHIVPMLQCYQMCNEVYVCLQRIMGGVNHPPLVLSSWLRMQEILFTFFIVQNEIYIELCIEAISFSRNLVVYYCKYCNPIGCTTLSIRQ